MNKLKNDRGQWVIAEGAPGSVARVRCEWPQLLDEMQAFSLKKVTETLGRRNFSPLEIESFFTILVADKMARYISSRRIERRGPTTTEAVRSRG